jgi:hypothetical protein
VISPPLKNNPHVATYFMNEEFLAQQATKSGIGTTQIIFHAEVRNSFSIVDGRFRYR